MHKANKRDLESDCVALLACIWEHRNGACDKCCPETRNGHDRHAEPYGRHTSRSKPKCAKCQERTCEKCSKEGGHERLDEQTYGGLARITGIPYETIRQMVQWFRKDPNHWALRNYGTKYGYVVRYVGKKVYPRRWHVRHVETDAGRHINVSVVLRGKTRRIGRFRSSEEAGAFIEYAENRIVSLERKILDVYEQELRKITAAATKRIQALGQKRGYDDEA